MVVVLGIISVMIALGANVWVSVRTQYILDQNAETALITIRDAQNRAISFSKSSRDPNQETKFWLVELGNNSVKLKGVTINGTVATANDEYANDFPSGLTANITGGGYLYFVPPFGQAYRFTATCALWNQSSTKPTKEYEPNCTKQTGSATYTLTFRGQDKTLTIYENGEAKIN